MKLNINQKVLLTINETPGIDLKSLCDKLSISKGNISFRLKFLEKDNLIQKLEEKGRKNLKLHPTKKGKDEYIKLKLELLGVSRRD